jgi:DNA-binding transcriptional ArsR family regulator
MECKTGGMVFALVMPLRFHYFGKMETKVALASLAAFAHATRLAAFRLLVEAGTEGRVAGEIAEALDVPAATLSFHLRELALAGLVDSEQRGRFVCYRANFSPA